MTRNLVSELETKRAELSAVQERIDQAEARIDELQERQESIDDEISGLPAAVRSIDVDAVLAGKSDAGVLAEQANRSALLYAEMDRLAAEVEALKREQWRCNNAAARLEKDVQEAELACLDVLEDRAAQRYLELANELIWLLLDMRTIGRRYNSAGRGIGLVGQVAAHVHLADCDPGKNTQPYLWVANANPTALSAELRQANEISDEDRLAEMIQRLADT